MKGFRSGRILAFAVNTWYTTVTGGSVPKRKPTAYERKLAADWEKVLANAAKPLERGAIAKGVKTKEVLKIAKPFTRSTPVYPSRVTVGGSTALRDGEKYTGSSMIGIGVAHKSGLVPVFSQESATDLARMRR